MSPNQPEVTVTRLVSGPGASSGDEEEDRHSSGAPPPPPPPTPARDIVRLYQCRLCSCPRREPVTLPCGTSICKKCIPQPHLRMRISYHAVPDRQLGFKCPLSECQKVHALRDCNIDVILNKAGRYMRDEMDRGKAQAVQLEATTRVSTEDPWVAAGVGSLGEHNMSKIIGGGKLLSTWALADEGSLKFDTEISYEEVPSSPDDGSTVLEEVLMRQAKEATRHEMDCQVCYSLFDDPLTTGCGHTFCRACLQRTLDHSPYCPVCRCNITVNRLLSSESSPSNHSITRIIETYWSGELVTRKAALEAEEAARHRDFGVPLFVCTMSFPAMPTFLHVFEPRYKLMIRRAMDGNRKFGMVLPKQPQSPEDAHFRELGTMLKIVNIQFYPDGRSLIETVGLWRFRVLRHGSLDGYVVGKIERIGDVNLEDEEAVEASEVMSGSNPTGGEADDAKSTTNAESSEQQPPPERSRPTTLPNFDTMSTQALMQYATDFVERMHEKSAPWLAQRMLSIYGNCPSDPAVFPWWLASLLPVSDAQKYRLLETSSVRARLKLSCLWGLEWEARTW